MVLGRMALDKWMRMMPSFRAVTSSSPSWMESMVAASAVCLDARRSLAIHAMVRGSNLSEGMVWLYKEGTFSDAGEGERRGRPAPVLYREIELSVPVQSVQILPKINSEFGGMVSLFEATSEIFAHLDF